MTDGRIRTEREGHRFHIVIDRAEKMNGFSPVMLRELAEAFTAFEESDARCAVLLAEGKHFTAGLDLNLTPPGEPLYPAGLVDPVGLRPPFRTKPVVAAVHGVCFTLGIELALAADIVVAARSTRFSQLEVKRGLFAFAGASIRMAERAGWGNAMMHLLTGDEFTAAEAFRLGFVQEVVEDGQERARAFAVADVICAQAPLAVQTTLRVARLAAQQGPDAAVATYASEISKLIASADFEEGKKSFVERRAGNFTGQ